MNELQEIGSKFGTDKSSHSYKGKTYLDVYNKYFNDKRNEVTVFVEIGILNGNSLKMWAEYFPNATIYGIDINPNCKQYETDRIKVLIGDQNDDVFLSTLKDQIPEIDILLDDGSHITRHQINTFNYLHENIKKGGYYIIEDLANSYEEILNQHDLRKIWPGMILNNPNDTLKNYREEFNVWVEQKIKSLDFREKENNIFSIHFYPMIVVFEYSKI